MYCRVLFGMDGRSGGTNAVIQVAMMIITMRALGAASGRLDSHQILPWSRATEGGEFGVYLSNFIITKKYLSSLQPSNDPVVKLASNTRQKFWGRGCRVMTHCDRYTKLHPKTSTEASNIKTWKYSPAEQLWLGLISPCLFPKRPHTVLSTIPALSPWSNQLLRCHSKHFFILLKLFAVSLFLTPSHSLNMPLSFAVTLAQYPPITASPPPLPVVEVVSVMAVGRLPAAGEILINSLFICVEHRAPAFWALVLWWR